MSRLLCQLSYTASAGRGDPQKQTTPTAELFRRLRRRSEPLYGIEP